MRLLPNTALTVAITALTAFISGCENLPGSEQTEVNEGVFIDAHVAGLRYASQSTSGVTDAQGRFDFVPGETVSFFLGNLKLGESTGANIVTPLHIAGADATVDDTKVINLLRLLQTLDDDDNPDNGIDITRFTELNVSGADNVDLESDNGLLQLVNEIDNSKTVVSAGVAMAHFQAQIAELELDFSETELMPGNGEVEFRVIVGDNGLSGTWKVETEFFLENAQGELEEQFVEVGEVYGEDIPLTVDDLFEHSLLQPVLSELTQITPELESQNSNVVKWIFSTPNGASPEANGFVLLSKISDTQPVQIATSTYFHTDAVWIKTQTEAHYITDPLGFTSVDEHNTFYQTVPGPNIPQVSLDTLASYENNKLPNQPWRTTRYTDTHTSDYYIQPVIVFNQATEPVEDDLQRTHFSTSQQSWKILHHPDYVNKINKQSNVQLTGSWEYDKITQTVNSSFPFTLTERNQPVDVADVPTTLAELDSFLSGMLLPGTFWIPVVRMDEQKVSWTIWIYGAGAPADKIGYTEIDLDFVKVN